MTPEELKAWRESLNMNQATFADYVGRCVRSVYYWESGEVPPPSWLEKFK